MLTVATINVNGVRAARRRGMGAWLARCMPDVLCLQEVRAGDDVLAEALGHGWHVVHEEAAAAGRAGVAVASRARPTATRASLPGLVDVDGAGRWVELDLPLRPDATGAGRTLTAASVYVHTGQAGTARQKEKERFLAAVARRLRELAADPSTHVLACGDFNVAHREIDLKNWKGNLKKAGFLPAERAWLDELLGSKLPTSRLLAGHPNSSDQRPAAGVFIDVHRRLAGDVAGPYTWWSWRGRAFDNDAGWRIDYQIASAALALRAVRAQVDRAPSYEERWSDHAPLIVWYDVTPTSGPSPLP